MAGIIYYVGQFRFPDVAANSLRVLGNAQALQKDGYDVRLIPGGHQPILSRLAKSELKACEGVPFLDLQFTGHQRCGQLARVFGFVLAGCRLASVLKRKITAETVAVIATAGGGSRYWPFLKQVCRRSGVPLVCDLMEWYEAEHLPFGKYGPFAWDNAFCMKYYFPRVGAIIAISSFLERYYAEHGCRVIRIPPLVDLGAEKWNISLDGEKRSRRLILCFVGSAGKKDFLVNAVRGLARLGNQAPECELRIAGPSKEELRTNLGSDGGLLETLEESLHFAGRLSHREALRHLKGADFSIVLRPDLRFAHAGFPTKLVESMAMGVPVICNLTGDIGRYVRDGQEALVVGNCSAEAFADGLRRASALSQEQRMMMRAHARQRAQLSFDYRNWAEPLGRFVRQVIEDFRTGKVVGGRPTARCWPRGCGDVSR